MLGLIRSTRTALQPTIVFTCEPSDRSVIAEPVPANSDMPNWFRKLPAVDPRHNHARNNGLTVKRCMPFLDALTTGWILPLAATVRLEISDGGATVDAGWELDRVMVSNHNMYQVAGHPNDPRPPCKFHNYWTITTPPGWSCLFVPPLNRPNSIVEIVSGVVDTDTYCSRIHFPFFAVAEDGTYTLERGMPLVQVIPFKRRSTLINGEVRTESVGEAEKREQIRRQTDASDGWYRRRARASR